MLSQGRSAKVFAATLISLTIGAVILRTLGNNPPSAGAFSLSLYYDLEPVEKVVCSGVVQSPRRWNCIEICYNSAKACNIKQRTSLSGLTSAEDIDCHFVVYNVLAGCDGLIQPTEKWQKQLPITPGRTCGGEQTIRICVTADGKAPHPTEFQIKRTEALAEALCRKFNIQPTSIYYPDNWW